MTGDSTDAGRGKWRPEEGLLLECAVPPSCLDASRLADAAGRVGDWERFLDLAVKTKLATLAYARVTGVDLPGGLPRPVLRRLGAAHVAAESAGRRLRAERDRLLQSWTAAGLPALPLKGCALADALYGDPALRPMGDLDFLIRAGDMPHAARVLDDAGYRTDGIDPRGETFFYRPGDGLYIDLHTELDPSGRFRIAAADLWRDAAPLPSPASIRSAAASSFTLSGQPTLRAAPGTDAGPPASPPAPSVPAGPVTLSVRHHMVHALLHAARHRLDSLGPLVDAAWIAAAWPDAVGWETLPELALCWRCRQALGFALEAAAVLFRLPVPEAVRSALIPGGWRRPALARLWPGDSPLRSIESRSKAVRYAFSALTTDGPGGFLGAARRFRPRRAVPAGDE